ncbi:uncharacterized protein LOC131428472 isoform X2 [Malaya genurostris]|uniref:uncharacterized protein LOC131428472 isoform X2 n=1 Tax=Malaya genurostris TaxID=325434 RepID=UPI0026F3C1CF|nr:uncharacterized protein LOC131428472 isoform X2 [Malaya genurostris]
MECKLISRYSPLLVLFIASLVSAQTGRKRDINNLYQVIYYGDSQVEVGKPFSISCIISIADPVEWHKDNEPIRKHSNIRHGKDEHSYIESEMGIAGNRDKIEATISVQHALPKHQGSYQCNSLYKNYHMLYVHRNGSLGSGGGGGAGGASSHAVKTTGHAAEGTLLNKLDEPVVGPLLLTTIKPTLITSITEHSTPVPLDIHTIGLEAEHSQHHHRQASSHHHHSLTGSDKSTKSDDQYAFKADSVRLMNKNQDRPTKETQTHPGGAIEREQHEAKGTHHGNKINKNIKVDGYHDTTKVSNKNGKDSYDTADNISNVGNVIVVVSEDGDGASGAFSVPLEEAGKADIDAGDIIPNHGNIQVSPHFNGDENGSDGVDPGDDDNDDDEASIVIESKDVSVEDSIDKLILNKSEINGIIQVDSEEIPPHRHQPVPKESGRKLDRIVDEKTKIVAVVPPTVPTSTTALVVVTSTSITTATAAPATTTTTTTTGVMSSTPGMVRGGHGTEGHHHHHHHEHDQEHRQRAASAEILQPNYDDPSTSLKYYDIGKALTLGCNITKEGYDLSWSKDGKNVSDIDSLKDRYRILNEERKFIISRALEADAGSYTCSVRALNASRTFNVVANVIVKFESTEIGKTNMVEGGSLTLHCLAFGSNPRISWIIGNKTYTTTTDHIHLNEDEKGVENARLTIESVTMSDYTEYICEGRNNATDVSGRPAHASITVRIRGKYAALYVFLGIIAEVVVLCAIILICERRRNKTEVEESDTDQSPDQHKNGHNGNASELRQRKS